MAGPMNLLVVGHGRHGKDTVCEILRDEFGMKFISSSEFVAREIIWDQIGHLYADFDDMFADRHNHRAEWMKMIAEYNTPDETRTAATMFSAGYNIYCGMRRREELQAGVAAGLFDSIWWVDRSLHLPPEDISSMTIRPTDADVFINNNAGLGCLRQQVRLAMYQRGQGHGS